MPHEIYSFVIERCFDACVGVNFAHKHLLNSEKECLGTCAGSFKQNPYVYQTMHQFQGFGDKGANDNVHLPGMGGLKPYTSGQQQNDKSLGTGVGRLGGGMI